MSDGWTLTILSRWRQRRDATRLGPLYCMAALPVGDDQGDVGARDEAGLLGPQQGLKVRSASGDEDCDRNPFLQHGLFLFTHATDDSITMG